MYIYIYGRYCIPWIFHALITTCQLGCTPSWPLPLSFSRDASAPPARLTATLPATSSVKILLIPPLPSLCKEKQIYPLVNWHSYWKWLINSWFTYSKWWFSIAMLVYQRVNRLVRTKKWCIIMDHQHPRQSWPFHKSSFEFMPKKCFKTVVSQKVHDCNCFLVHLHWGLKMV